MYKWEGSMAASFVNNNIYCDISGNFFFFLTPLTYKITSLRGKSRDSIKIVKLYFSLICSPQLGKKDVNPEQLELKRRDRCQKQEDKGNPDFFFLYSQHMTGRLDKWLVLRLSRLVRARKWEMRVSDITAQVSLSEFSKEGGRRQN